MSCITSQGTTLWAENPSPFKEMEGEEKRKRETPPKKKVKGLTHHILYIHFQDNAEEEGGEENSAKGKVFTRSVFQGGNSFEESGCN